MGTKRKKEDVEEVEANDSRDNCPFTTKHTPLNNSNEGNR